jgi:hypothetical protein
MHSEQFLMGLWPTRKLWKGRLSRLLVRGAHPTLTLNFELFRKEPKI